MAGDWKAGARTLVACTRASALHELIALAWLKTSHQRCDVVPMAKVDSCLGPRRSRVPPFLIGGKAVSLDIACRAFMRGPPGMDCSAVDDGRAKECRMATWLEDVKRRMTTWQAMITCVGGC
jgi:hypothetical protein